MRVAQLIAAIEAVGLAAAGPLGHNHRHAQLHHLHHRSTNNTISNTTTTTTDSSNSTTIYADHIKIVASTLDGTDDSTSSLSSSLSDVSSAPSSSSSSISASSYTVLESALSSTPTAVGALSQTLDTTTSISVNTVYHTVTVNGVVSTASANEHTMTVTDVVTNYVTATFSALTPFKMPAVKVAVAASSSSTCSVKTTIVTLPASMSPTLVVGASASSKATSSSSSRYVSSVAKSSSSTKKSSTSSKKTSTSTKKSSSTSSSKKASSTSAKKTSTSSKKATSTSSKKASTSSKKATSTSSKKATSTPSKKTSTSSKKATSTSSKKATSTSSKKATSTSKKITSTSTKKATSISTKKTTSSSKRASTSTVLSLKTTLKAVSINAYKPSTSSQSSVKITSSSVKQSTSSSVKASSSVQSSSQAASSSQSGSSTCATVTPPAPTQTGIVSGCTKWYTAKSGDYCYVIAEAYGISTSEFISWNPAVGSGCGSVYVGYSYCVATCDVSGSAAATTLTATGSVTTSAASSAAATSTSSGSSSGVTTYKMYTGNGTVAAGWPSQDQWVDFETMFTANTAIMLQSCGNNGWGANDSEDEIADIKTAITTIAEEYAVDPRFILAIVMQESNGCVRVVTTSWSVQNPGLMQDHAGNGTCNDGGVIQNPCPYSEIYQMVKDGTAGTSSGDGLVQCLSEVDVTDVSMYYRAARMYNGGSGGYNADDLGSGCCTLCYASDVANRLTGWSSGASGCTL